SIFIILHRPPISTLFPYTTLFRSEHLFNDFETGIFHRYPEIRGIKSMLYERGAIYAAMSGSGSTVYGLFKEELDLKKLKAWCEVDRKSTRLNSSHVKISYAVFCLK